MMLISGVNEEMGVVIITMAMMAMVIAIMMAMVVTLMLIMMMTGDVFQAALRTMSRYHHETSITTEIIIATQLGVRHHGESYEDPGTTNTGTSPKTRLVSLYMNFERAFVLPASRSWITLCIISANNFAHSSPLASAMALSQAVLK